jgi:aspartate-semialdehyde dehydrogenase
MKLPAMLLTKSGSKKRTMSIDVAILGATGAVGQRFIQLLENHPWFRIAEVVASERSSDKAYAEAANWVLTGDIPATVARLTVKSLDSTLTSPLVFSALPSDIARGVEERLARAGHIICSNASAYRMDESVPLLLPEANAEHIHLIPHQREVKGWDGAIITNSNCTSAPLVMALAPLRPFKPEAVNVVSMQAVSGAGYPGVPSLDILDNVIPFIGGEEGKVESEPNKMLGALVDGEIQSLGMTISATCNRVAVIDSHLIVVAVRFAENPSLDDIIAAWEGFSGPAPVPTLPSAPEKPVIYAPQDDRPQPRRDRDAGKGMSTVVGRLRENAVIDGVQFHALAHNTIRGAAGCSILNAELLVAEGYLATEAAAVSAGVTV